MSKLKIPDQYQKNNKLVAVWVPRKDYDALLNIASLNKVNLAAYVRAIIVDAVCDELCVIQSKTSTVKVNRRAV